MPPADYIDLYCERTAPGLLGEPLNTLGNLAFFAVAAWLARRLAADPRARRDDWLLTGLVALVGVGSLVFHLFATRATSVYDRLFIGVFILVFLHRTLVRVMGLGGWTALVAVVIFAFASRSAATATITPTVLNGSLAYLPAVLGLAGIAAWSGWKRNPAASIFVATIAVFLLALVCRTIDLMACDAWPYGTHFLWHMLVAAVLGLACTGLRRGTPA